MQDKVRLEVNKSEKGNKTMEGKNELRGGKRKNKRSCEMMNQWRN
jgi:hypothetical protein